MSGRTDKGLVEIARFDKLLVSRAEGGIDTPGRSPPPILHVTNGFIARRHGSKGEGLAMKVRDVVRMLLADGWFEARTRGSHRQFERPEKAGLVTVPGRPNDDLAQGTLKSILKQAGLRRR